MKKILKPLVVGNWKLTPANLDEARNRYNKTVKSASKFNNIEVVVCPPAVFIAPLSKPQSKTSKNTSKNSNKNIKNGVQIGAQNVSVWSDGSKTGEIAASMVRSVGGSLSIVGHSERRAMGETDEQIAEKVAEVLKNDMIVVLCVGEKERDEHGDYLEIIKDQIKRGLARVSKKEAHRVVIAYEPVWAIGRTDNVAITSHDLHQMSIFIRKYLKELFSIAGDLIRIIYGGSVTPENVSDLYVNGDVSGFLPGRSSWDVDVFQKVLESISDSMSQIKKQSKKTKNKVEKRTNKRA
jgi:triosephosphate isomerase